MSNCHSLQLSLQIFNKKKSVFLILFFSGKGKRYKGDSLTARKSTFNPNNFKKGEGSIDYS